jgi:hypothetical protein
MNILNISCIDLNAKYADLNAKHVELNASCFNLNVNCIDFNTKCLDLNVILKTKIERNSNAYINYNLTKTKKATYKDLNHRVNYCKLSLSGDIEVNPGPAFVNPGKTIHAPYSQGNVDVFGENAGRQCVAISLCSLIYVPSILDTSALVNIMNLGNELYSMLSRISRQIYLLLTELPTMVTV